MIGVLVKDSSGNVIAKRVYCGDDDISLKSISQDQDNDKLNIYEIHKDTEKTWTSEFENVQSAKVPTKDQLDWKAIKNTPAALSFLANKLGLE